MNDLENYLDILFEGLEGYVYSPVKSASSWEQKFFEYPAQRNELIEWIQTNSMLAGHDVYISPATYQRKSATKDSLRQLQVAWVEFDGMERINYRAVPIPSAQVQTSLSTHLHSYWRIEPSNWQDVEDINRRLTYYLEADSSGWDATQLLRPPDTTNYKHNLPVRLVHYEQTLFKEADFLAAPAISHQANPVSSVGDLKSVLEIVTNHSLPNRVIRMIKRETPTEGHRSSFLAKLATELAEEGLEHIEIVSLLYETDKRVGKYSGRTDQMVRLSQLADYALHKLVVEDSVIVYSVEDILNSTEELVWILPPWLHTSGQLILSSAPGVGKTQLAFQIAYCVLGETPFLGQRLGHSMNHSILFMSLEMDKRSLKYILSRHRKEWKNIPARLSVIDEATSLTQYENLIEDRQITLLIVDSLTELFDDTSDNPNSEARRVMKWCRKIRRRYGLAIIIIHHNRKATEGNKKPKGLADLAGSFQFAKDSDTVIQLWEDHRGMELSTPKVRYGMKEAFYIERNQNLWFNRKGGNDDNSGEREPVQPNPSGDSEQQSSSDRHRNDVDESVSGTEALRIRFGFGR